MDFLSIIKRPIDSELSAFVDLFNESLSHPDGLLGSALSHIRARGGKRMRPMLMLLMAKNFGQINDSTLNAAVGLELLHTASLVHDDVVDESEERRGQLSMNASYGNKVAVLVGDYILSTALLYVSKTHHEMIIRRLARLGRVLSNGEILQLTNTVDDGLSETMYYKVIEKKTAALFEACCAIGALSAGKQETEVAEAIRFGQVVGIIFQIRDDIFDYFDAKDIGKPTGNDMTEGKLTLPAIYAINSTRDAEMTAIAKKVKERSVSPDEIARLVAFTKQHGGIEYAEKCMMDFHREAADFIDHYIVKQDIKESLSAYLDFVIQRNN